MTRMQDFYYLWGRLLSLECFQRPAFFLRLSVTVVQRILDKDAFIELCIIVCDIELNNYHLHYLGSPLSLCSTCALQL